MAKRYYWLKLQEDFFDDETIKYIEEQENGIKYSNFYLKLCLKSLKTEGVLIRLVGETLLPYDVNSLAKLTGVDVDTVICSMNLFQKIGLINVLESGEIFVSQINEMIGSETDKAILMRRKRAKEKLIGNNVTKMLPKCYTEIEKEIDIDIEKEKEKEKEKEMINLIVELYNLTCINLPQIKKMNEKRNKAIKKFIKEFSEDEIKEIFLIANNSEFLTGENDRGWKADFDFIMRIDKATAILEGKYDNKKKTGFEDLKKIWEEAKIEDEQTGNNADNSFTGW